MRQKRQRLVDQIVVIEQAAALLLVVIARQHLMGDGQQRGGAIAADHGAPAIQQRADAVLFRAQTFDQVGILDRLGDDRFARRALVAVQKMSR